MTSSLDKTVHSPGQAPLLPLWPLPSRDIGVHQEAVLVLDPPFYSVPFLISSQSIQPLLCTHIPLLPTGRTNASSPSSCLSLCPVESRCDYQQHGVLFLFLKLHLKLKLITIKQFYQHGESGGDAPKKGQITFP